MTIPFLTKKYVILQNENELNDKIFSILHNIILCLINTKNSTCLKSFEPNINQAIQI